MLCQETNSYPIKIEFDRGVTLYPQQATLRYDSDEYDYFSCKVDSDTADEVQRLAESGSLSYKQVATVYVNDQPVRAMLYRPDLVQTGTTHADADYQHPGHIELHDLHQHLQNGVVDWAPTETTVKETYNRIFRTRSDRGLFNGIDVRVSGEFSTGDATDDAVRLGVETPVFSDEFEVDAGYAINFEEISPLKALEKANNAFGVKSHVDVKGNLIIGQYVGSSGYTASENGDGVDFHVQNAGISNPKNTLTHLNVEGPILEIGKGPLDPNNAGPVSESEKMYEAIEWLSTDQSLGDGGYRARAEIRDRSAVTEPETVPTVEAHNAKPGELKGIGKRQFRAMKMKRQKGTITVNTSNSETQKPVAIGDTIQLADPDTCGDLRSIAYPGGEYLTTGVNHQYDGVWTTALDVVRSAPESSNLIADFWLVDTDPNSKTKKYTYEEIFGVPLAERKTSPITPPDE